jgi:LVIVD repeat
MRAHHGSELERSELERLRTTSDPARAHPPVVAERPLASREQPVPVAGTASQLARAGVCHGRTTRQRLLVAIALVMTAGAADAQQPPVNSSGDPRVGLGGGHWVEAAAAISNLVLVAHRDRPPEFVNATGSGSWWAYINSDLAFSGHTVFQGNFHGIQIWDVSNPSEPTLRTTIVCPGGQGDPSVYGHLLFVSVEMPNGRVDCGVQGVHDAASPDRFRGVRIFDISDIDHPRQVAAVQTCRGSHTHTLVPDPKDPGVVYVYVQGTSPVRPAAELAGCSGLGAEQDPNTSRFRIEIIRVPLAHPEDAKVINAPRIFANAGAINGLAKAVRDSLHGHEDPLYHASEETDQCHDITVYPAIGLAAGACSGNGLLLDIRDPANPKRIRDLSDPNFAYWHSATFNNDGSKVVFTDEWGGGALPKCLSSDPRNWGADAIYTINPDRTLRFDSYYKLPAVQTVLENCVAHNGSLIPVPGRDILVQAWYQGGISIVDFTDAAHPVEIAYFDRGPVDATRLVQGGYWAAYWYDGHIYGSEIARGFDVFELAPSAHLTQHEIDAAKLVHFDISNPSDQQQLTWPASFVVARAYIDQLARDGGLSADQLTHVSGAVDAAEQTQGRARLAALKTLASEIDREIKGSSDPRRVRMLAATLRDMSMTA